MARPVAQWNDREPSRTGYNIWYGGAHDFPGPLVDQEQLLGRRLAQEAHGVLHETVPSEPLILVLPDTPYTHGAQAALSACNPL